MAIVIFILSLLLPHLVLNIPQYQPFDNPNTVKMFGQFHCYKLKTCTPGGNKVCGFDDTKSFLAEFEDLCTLHKANCDGNGLFNLVEKEVCETKKMYLDSHKNDSFQFEHHNVYSYIKQLNASSTPAMTSDDDDL